MMVGTPSEASRVFRVSGARHFAVVAIDLIVIMVHARFQSDVLLRYVQEFSLVALTDTYKRLSTS